jgi:hypothetical protein
MNHDLERELPRALRPHEPSSDFAERVMARVAEQSPAVVADARRESETLWQRLTGIFQMPQWQMPQLRWAAAGALACLLVTFGVIQYRQQQRLEAERLAAAQAAEQAEGERAKEQVMLALQIASAKLNVAQRKINESSERTSDAR